MRTPLNLRLRLGAKLGLAFTGVLAVMLASLVVVLQKSSDASHAYERAIAWKSAVEGAAEQADGTRQQQASQALYVATGEAALQARVAGGRRTRPRRRGAAVEALNDPVITKLAAGGDRQPTSKHDASVNDKLFPAMERGDGAAAHAALLLADKYVRVPLEAQEKIGAYVRKRQASDVAAADSAAAAARTAGILAGLLATLLAAAIVFLVSRGIRRSAAQVLEPPERARERGRRRAAGRARRRRERRPHAFGQCRHTRHRQPRRGRDRRHRAAPPTASAPGCMLPSTPTTGCAAGSPG